MTYRVALVGAGNMGKWHAEQWGHVPGVEFVAAMDTRSNIDLSGTPVFSDWNTMIAQAKPDIIDICTPTPFHREYVERAAAAGKAIFVEKPLARTLEDCDSIMAAVGKAGVPAMPGHVVRYFPEYASAKQIVDEGGVGHPGTVRTSRMSTFPNITGRENWYADPDQSGGVILDLILHDFDWLRWTFGPVNRVFARGLFGSRHFMSALDYALVTLRFASGAVGHVTGSWAHTEGFRTTVEIAGDKGIVEHDSTRSAPLTVALRRTDCGQIGVTVPESPMRPQEDPYLKELQAFVRSLETGQTTPVTTEDAYEAARIAFAALRSIETGKAVTL